MVLIFGAVAVAHHLALGVGSILTALLIYGFRAALLQSRYLQMQQAWREASDNLERLSLEDGLTCVANRRHLDGFLRRSWEEALRTSRAMSFLLLDVDHFKDLNDRHGHQAGDQCLARIAAALQAATRRTDLVARYGGEEFAVVLPHTDLTGALQVADAIRSAVHGLRIENQTRDGPYLTMSVGAASTQNLDQTLDSLVEAADRALYAAKQRGRDRVVAAPPVDIDIPSNESAMA